MTCGVIDWICILHFFIIGDISGDSGDNVGFIPGDSFLRTGDNGDTFDFIPGDSLLNTGDSRYIVGFILGDSLLLIGDSGKIISFPGDSLLLPGDSGHIVSFPGDSLLILSVFTGNSSSTGGGDNFSTEAGEDILTVDSFCTGDGGNILTVLTGDYFIPGDGDNAVYTGDSFT